MSSVTPEDACQYLERWKLVEEREITELRNTPIEVKARQLADLMASRNLFREDPDREGCVKFRHAGLDFGTPSLAERIPASRQDVMGLGWPLSGSSCFSEAEVRKLPLLELPVVELPMLEPLELSAWRNCENRPGWWTGKASGRNSRRSGIPRGRS